MLLLQTTLLLTFTVLVHIVFIVQVQVRVLVVLLLWLIHLFGILVTPRVPVLILIPVWQVDQRLGARLVCTVAVVAKTNTNGTLMERNEYIHGTPTLPKEW